MTTEMLYKTYKHILNEDDLDTIDFIITKRANEKAKKDKVSNNN